MTRRRADLLIALILFAFASLGSLTMFAAVQGLTYDEPVYAAVGERHLHWYGQLLTGGALAREALERGWGNAGPTPTEADWHPPVGKLILALARRLPVPGGVFAQWRCGNVFLFAATAALLFLWLSRVRGRVAGGAAALAWLSLPRAVAHGNLASVDLPAAAFAMLALALAWRAACRPTAGRGVAYGIALAMAMGSKFNGILAAPAVLVWVALCRREAWRPVVLGTCLVAPAVFWLLWPWLWYDGLTHFGQVAAFMGRHGYVGTLYLGRVYNSPPPPWHYPFVMLAVTTPVLTMATAILGAARFRPSPAGAPATPIPPPCQGGGRGRSSQQPDTTIGADSSSTEDALAIGGGPGSGAPGKSPGERRAGGRDLPPPPPWQGGGSPGSPHFGGSLESLLLLALLCHLLPFALPSSAKYNGVRLFLPALPPLAALSGLGLARLCLWVARRVRLAAEQRWMVPVVAALAVYLPAVVGLFQVYPYPMAYFNALAGGAGGAEKRGFEVIYWGDPFRECMIWLSHNAPPGAHVYLHPPGAIAMVNMYRGVGILRDDLRLVHGDEAARTADYLVYQNRPSEWDPLGQQLAATKVPCYRAMAGGATVGMTWPGTQTGTAWRPSQP
ncbi:MAG: glycosyltransferase family 39 protein [Armatimonadetes bacterium]|nr:glycosyltransferase family 39 protein [Armatimonadota bacterium]